MRLLGVVLHLDLSSSAVLDDSWIWYARNFGGQSIRVAKPLIAFRMADLALSAYVYFPVGLSSRHECAARFILRKGRPS
jgi:hypothetical protein